MYCIVADIVSMNLEHVLLLLILAIISVLWCLFLLEDLYIGYSYA